MVMGIMVPTDNVRESIIAVNLRKFHIMADKKFSIIERNRLEIGNFQHLYLPSKWLVVVLSINMNPRNDKSQNIPIHETSESMMKRISDILEIDLGFI